MPRALDAERHAISQELPSHSRLPVCRPCDSALACRQYRLWCAWSASFGKPSPWQCLVHSMQSPMPSVRTSLPSRALLCADRVTRPLCDDGIGSRVPMYRPLCADRVRFPRHVNCASSHPTQNHPTPRVGGMFYTALEYRCLGPCVPTVSALVCRPCAVSPPLILRARALVRTARLSPSGWRTLCACMSGTAPAIGWVDSCVPGQQAS